MSEPYLVAARVWLEFNLSEDSGGDESAKHGFEIYRASKVTRLGPNQFLVRTDSGVGSFFVERVDGGWKCDCGPGLSYCAHRHAARLCAAGSTVPLNDDAPEAKCRYCGSMDVSRCGFRYNSYGIARRYRCNECMRKFSLKYTDAAFTSRLPSEMMWLLAEIGMVLNKLEDLMEGFAKLYSTGQLPIETMTAEQSVE
jgi:hypothetical protein